jgi:hypothetical protein
MKIRNELFPVKLVIKREGLTVYTLIENKIYVDYKWSVGFVCRCQCGRRWLAARVLERFSRIILISECHH